MHERLAAVWDRLDPRAAGALVAARRRSRSRRARGDLRRQPQRAERPAASRPATARETARRRRGRAGTSSRGEQTMNCDTIDSILDDHLVARLGPPERQRAAEHVGACARCSAAWAADDALRGETIADPAPNCLPRYCVASPRRPCSAKWRLGSRSVCRSRARRPPSPSSRSRPASSFVEPERAAARRLVGVAADRCRVALRRRPRLRRAARCDGAASFGRDRENRGDGVLHVPPLSLATHSSPTSTAGTPKRRVTCR